MSLRMVHPGPRSGARMQALRTRLVAVRGRLPAGRPVMDAVAALYAAAGCRGGVLALDGLACAPLCYVLPAPATDGLHGAWYSDTRELPGTGTILRGTAIVGQRQGAAFLHCHGLWRGGDGATRMGHLLPADSVVAAGAEVAGLGAQDAWFEALPDAETAFTLFRPHGRGDTAAPGLVARVLPGEDVVAAIEALAHAHGIAAARLHGVGSIDHVRFEDGSRMDCHATELRLDGALLRDGRARVPVEVVDIAGRIARGVLARDANPVGVTLELVIEPLESP